MYEGGVVCVQVCALEVLVAVAVAVDPSWVCVWVGRWVSRSSLELREREVAATEKEEKGSHKLERVKKQRMAPRRESLLSRHACVCLCVCGNVVGTCDRGEASVTSGRFVKRREGREEAGMDRTRQEGGGGWRRTTQLPREGGEAGSRIRESGATNSASANSKRPFGSRRETCERAPQVSLPLTHRT